MFIVDIQLMVAMVTYFSYHAKVNADLDSYLCTGHKLSRQANTGIWAKGGPTLDC